MIEILHILWTQEAYQNWRGGGGGWLIRSIYLMLSFLGQFMLGRSRLYWYKLIAAEEGALDTKRVLGCSICSWYFGWSMNNYRHCPTMVAAKNKRNISFEIHLSCICIFWIEYRHNNETRQWQEVQKSCWLIISNQEWSCCWNGVPDDIFPRHLCFPLHMG